MVLYFVVSFWVSFLALYSFQEFYKNQHYHNKRAGCFNGVVAVHVRIQSGGRGSANPSPPLEITKNKGFLSNTGSDPLKITKLPI